VSGFPSRRRSILALAATVALLSCSDNGGTSAPPTTATTDSTSVPATAPPTAASTTTTTTEPTGTIGPISPTLVNHDCPQDYPAAARCSTLTVLADPSNPRSDTIDLPIVVLPATGPAPAHQAVVIPGGGPGYPGINLRWQGSWLNEQFDIVLYDQRGTGASTPSLECPSRDAEFAAILQSDDSYEVERDAMRAEGEKCLAAAQESGIDLANYNSETSAQNLDDIRQALGYDQWNILGISYGARLALATMRSHPDGVRSVILDSVYDVTYGGLAHELAGIEAAILHLAAGCAADATCTANHGDLAAKMVRTRDKYNANPAEVEVDLEDGNGPQRFVITGDDMTAGVFNALYDAQLIPLLPTFIDRLLAGDTSIIPALVRDGIAFQNGAADLMSHAVDCADNKGLGTAAADTAAYENPGPLALVAASAGTCEADWPATPGNFNEPVVSDIPALVLAGSYDPITPPADTQAVAERLGNATFALANPVGHGVTGFDDCVRLVEIGFLTDPSIRPDVGCIVALPGPQFT
jgi:pimeloyl-ACP methyl ester carboxylesterase